MNHYNEYKEDIDKAVKVLKDGGIILYPTDTIWGIGCDATNEEAVSRIYKLKKRPDTQSMLVLIESDNRLAYYVKEVPDIAWDLIDISDKPLTIIYPGARNLADNLISADGTIGIRICQDSFCSLLIKKLSKALVSTSANRSGIKSPANFSGIEPDIIKGVDYVVKYRQDDEHKNQASGIIRIGIKGEIEVLRK